MEVEEMYAVYGPGFWRKQLGLQGVSGVCPDTEKARKKERQLEGHMSGLPHDI